MENIFSISSLNVFFLYQATSTITLSPQCCIAQRNQVMSRPCSPQGPCTPQVAAAGKSSPTTTWSTRTAPSPAAQSSQTAVAQSWRPAPSTLSSSLTAAPAGGPDRGDHAREDASQTAARGRVRQTAVPQKGNPKAATCVVSAASRTPHPPI